MSNNPDEIRADIERTRQELGRDVDALAEKVNPTKAVPVSYTHLTLPTILLV